MMRLIGSSFVCAALVSFRIEVSSSHGSWEVYAQISFRALLCDFFMIQIIFSSVEVQ